MADPTGRSPAGYRLRWVAQGVERSHVLRPGASQIGSAATSDITIPVRGVSRAHATLVVGDEDVRITDLGSKNGTFVDGERVTEGIVRCGGVIRLGPAELRLEAADPGDTELALLLDEPPAPPPRGPGPEDTTFETGRGGEIGSASTGLALAEAILQAFAGSPDGAGAALGRLCLAAGGTAASVLEGAGPGGVCLAAHGRPPSLPEPHPLWDEQARAQRLAVREAVCVSGVTTSIDGPLAYAVVARPSWAPITVLVGGGRAGDESVSLVRLLARLLDVLRVPDSGSAAGPLPPPAGGLVFPEGYVAGESAAMREVHRALLPLLDSDLPVLIEGETGVGKEWVARVVHASSPRRDGPFLAVNCAAIPADLMEAEMFGVSEGAATGVRAREGKFEAASGGILFLDEIGEMPLLLQAKLLRALEQKEVAPVGGQPRRVDVRILAATNCDLAARVEEGRFRADLYYRVAGSVVRVPPLRDRAEDIPVFVESFLRRLAAAAGKPVRGVTLKALEQLVAYPWPGNVRELEHELSRLVQASTPRQAIDSTLLAPRVSSPATGSPTPPGGSLRLEDSVQEAERRSIRQALERAGGSQRRAAQMLGISRNALARKIARLGIVPRSAPQRG